MILNKQITINVAARNYNKILKYYPNAICGQTLNINQNEALELSVTSKLECQCDNCGQLYTQEADRLNRKPMRKQLCGNCMFEYGQNNMKKTVSQSEHRKQKSILVSQYYEQKRKQESDYYKNRIFTKQEYTYEIRKATNRTYTKYKNIINPQKLPIGRNEYHIDHIITIKYGYINDISIDIMSHHLNLRILSASENLKRRFVLNEEEMLNNLFLINENIRNYK